MSQEENKIVNYNCNEIDGIKVPVFFSKEIYESIYDMVPFKDNDVIISTYPKSGTTWTQNILYNLLHEDPIPEGLKLTDVIPWHEISIEDKCGNVLEEPFRCFKSHLDWNMTFKPENVNVRYIYVCRNGKDCCVSMFHHTTAFKSWGYNGDWEDFFERFITGNVMYGKWADHILSWWKVKERDNVLFLFYEDMKNDIRTEIKKIIDFLGIEVTDERIDHVIQRTTFNSMKNDPKTNQTDYKARNLDKPKFMRKGEIGDWVNYFTDEQNERFDEMYQELILNKTNNELNFQFTSEDLSNNDN